ncbi:MAG: archease [Candidatus Sulfobium sp.]|jgi:SHS2 domain-containing protein
MKRFELVDISGDAGIVAFGRSIKELFENAAAGMYSLVTDPEPIREKKTLSVAVEKDSLEGLLVAWLNELIFRFDVDGFIAKKIVITGFPEEAVYAGREVRSLAVRASLSGEDFDPSRHEGKLLLKAATYHDLLIEKKGDIWRSKIIFDV